ncbi:MAG TPA: gamma-glutamyl-gamma-aminobutyrate hydrolase family protein [Terriglobales bacterium]
MRPRIAIPLPNSDANYSARVLPQYARAVEMAGGTPVQILLTSSNAEVAQLAKNCHGVLLPGSPADVDPQKYGVAERHPKTAAADPARDNVDELLLQDAHNMRKPLLGICYGVQSLNVWRNGTLLQHIESPVKHARFDSEPQGTVVTHAAVVESGSLLASIIAPALANANTNDPLEITVNSSHHQSVEQPGDGLRVVARSPLDGVFEAIEGVAPGHWVLGVQWHPERTFNDDAISREIFRSLVRAAAEWQARASSSSADFESVSR